MQDSTLSNLFRSKTIMALVYLASLTLLVYAAAFAYQRYQKALKLNTEFATAAQPVNGVTKNKPAVSGTQQVAALSLFGKKAVKAEPAPEVINAPITRLKLTLLGAIAADNAEKSSAIIQIDNKQLAIVQVGDPLPGTNAKIHQIQPTQVVLMRNGKLERLAIIRPELEMAEQDDGNDILIKSSGSAGGSLLTPINMPKAPLSRQATRRAATPKSNVANKPARPAYPPPPFEMPPLQPPPRQ